MRALKIQKSLTRRDEKSIGRYLNAISKYAVLSPDEELQLFRQVEVGDEAALEKVIRHNLRFVVSVAKQYQHMGLGLADLINEGNIGLIKAAHRFDSTKGFKFISYAVWWIRQCILVAIKEKARKIRLPGNVRQQIKHIEEAQLQIRQTEEREATLAEIADLTDLKVDTIRDRLKASQNIEALDAPLRQEDSFSRYQLMSDSNIPAPDHELMTHTSRREAIQLLLDKLSPRHALVVKQYFGIGQAYPSSLSDIASNLNLSKERVRQVKDRALIRMRAHLRREREELVFG